MATSNVYRKEARSFIVYVCFLPILVALIVLSSREGEAQTFVKTVGTSSSKSTGTTLNVFVPASGVAAGNSVIVTLAFDPASGAVLCSDTRGNSYSVDKDITNGSGTSGVRVVV